MLWSLTAMKVSLRSERLYDQRELRSIRREAPVKTSSFQLKGCELSSFSVLRIEGEELRCCPSHSS